MGNSMERRDILLKAFMIMLENYENEEKETRTGKLNFVKIEDTWYLDIETSPNFMYLFLGSAE